MTYREEMVPAEHHTTFGPRVSEQLVDIPYFVSSKKTFNSYRIPLLLINVGAIVR